MKRCDLDEAAALVPDGATVAIGGLSMNSTPMALVRALVRRKVRDLTVVAIVQGMAVDWLVAGGCVGRVISGLVSFEGLGMAPKFRAAVQSGDVGIEEYSEHTLICALQADDQSGAVHADARRHRHRHAGAPPRHHAARDRPGDGPALPGLHAAGGRRGHRPRPRRRRARQRPGRPEAAVDGQRDHQRGDHPHRHRRAHRAHRRVHGGPAPDHVPPLHDRRRRRGAVGRLPVVDVPHLHPRPASSSSAYTAAATVADATAFDSFWEERVVGPAGHGAFLDANGGAGTLLRIRRRTVLMRTETIDDSATSAANSTCVPNVVPATTARSTS